MARVALDADVVIAFLDPSDAQHPQAVELLREHLASGDDILIAATVYAEVISKPLSMGQTARSISFSLPLACTRRC
jgi:predicted nucleic acid-binding protein